MLMKATTEYFLNFQLYINKHLKKKHFASRLFITKQILVYSNKTQLDRNICRCPGAHPQFLFNNCVNQMLKVMKSCENCKYCTFEFYYAVFLFSFSFFLTIYTLNFQITPLLHT